MTANCTAGGVNEPLSALSQTYWRRYSVPRLMRNSVSTDRNPTNFKKWGLLENIRSSILRWGCLCKQNNNEWYGCRGKESEVSAPTTLILGEKSEVRNMKINQNLIYSIHRVNECASFSVTNVGRYVIITMRERGCVIVSYWRRPLRHHYMCTTSLSSILSGFICRWDLETR